MKVFSIRGTVRDVHGRPARDLMVTIYDRDPANDDLLGVVRTNHDGAFALRFADSEFRQDLLEHEEVPDPSVVVWKDGPEGPLVLVERDFDADLFDATSDVDLGAIALPCPRDELVGDPEAEAIRGHRRRGLVLDERLFEHAKSRVLPLVEASTGWAGLGEHVEPEFVDDFVQVNRIYQAYLEGTLDELEVPTALEHVVDTLQGAGFENRYIAGIYEPLTRRVLINANIGAALTLESFMVLLGHELVHLGQFVHHPKLLERKRQAVQWEAEHLYGSTLGDASDVAFMEFAMTMPLHTLMTDLEGHAQHIEQDVLELEYGAQLPPTASLFERALGWLTEEVGGLGLEPKMRQYVLGRQYMLHAKRERGEDRAVDFADASVFLREFPYMRLLTRAVELAGGGELAQARAKHAEFMSAQARILGASHPRCLDARFQHAFLMSLDTDDTLEAHAYLERELDALARRLGPTHPLSLRERYRATALMARNEALHLSWAYVAPVLATPQELERGLDACSDWFEAGFARTFATGVIDVGGRLRKSVEEKTLEMLEGYAR